MCQAVVVEDTRMLVLKRLGLARPVVSDSWWLRKTRFKSDRDSVITSELPAYEKSAWCLRNFSNDTDNPSEGEIQQGNFHGRCNRIAT